MKLLHVLPRLAPWPDGVGDFALGLAETLNVSGVESRFLVTDPNWPGGKQVLGFAAERLSEKSAEALGHLLKKAVLSGETVILHYVGYGYAPDGAPTWLAEAVEQLGRGEAFFVFVHEPWADGKPWQRVFWTASRQKDCLRRILVQARRAATSCGGFLQGIQSLKPDLELTRLPLLVAALPKVAMEKNYSHYLILGQAEPRLRAIQWMGSWLAHAERKGRLNKMILAGRSGEGTARAEKELLRFIPSAKLETCYDFSWESIPEAITTCGIAVQHTQTTYLAKSTSFLTSLQWGQVAVARLEHTPDAPIELGRHVLGYQAGHEAELDALLADTPALKQLSLAGRELYSGAFSPAAVREAWRGWLGKSG